MCGIVGYTGDKPALGFLLAGLQSLEYRGYDSAGVALVDSAGIQVVRRAGKVAELVEAAKGHLQRPDTMGIGHTRWATCGAPTEPNAHPHLDCAGRIALVHNGIIENHLSIRDRLLTDGHTFRSETDTECLVHLIEAKLASGASLLDATRLTLADVEGSYAVAVVDANSPDVIVAACRDVPLVLGPGKGENFVASDVVAIMEHVRSFIPLTSGQIAEVTPSSLRVFDSTGAEQTLRPTHISWDHAAAEKEGYAHFMLKEIHEQPSAVRETLRGRSDEAGRLMLDELRISDEEVRGIDKVFVVACGSSFHAGLVAKYAIERWTRLPVEIDVASEFRYRDPVLDPSTLVVGISQSGETADTLAAVRYAHEQGAKVVAITNVVGSSITREADAVLYTHAGPEIGVAATKTLATQMIALWLLALWMAQVLETRNLEESRELLDHLHELPSQIEEVLSDTRAVQRLAKLHRDAATFLFIGRGVGFPVALEGALKLKELTYCHAEGFAAGEMKHGPIALIEKGVPVLAVATASRVQAKLLSNIEEAKVRGAKIIALANLGDSPVEALADEVLWVPATSELLSPVVDLVPLQLFAYYVAAQRGLDPDKPRNLAKSVTVE